MVAKPCVVLIARIAFLQKIPELSFETAFRPWWGFTEKLPAEVAVGRPLSKRKQSVSAVCSIGLRLMSGCVAEICGRLAEALRATVAVSPSAGTGDKCVGPISLPPFAQKKARIKDPGAAMLCSKIEPGRVAVLCRGVSSPRAQLAQR